VLVGVQWLVTAGQTPPSSRCGLRGRRLFLIEDGQHTPATALNDPQSCPHIHMARIGSATVPIGDLRDFVLKRDGNCILRSTSFPGHVCYARWGLPDAPARRDEDFSLEHVTQVHDHLDGRKDDDAHTVALCFRTNIKPPSKEERMWMRNRLRSLHPRCR